MSEHEIRDRLIRLEAMVGLSSEEGLRREMAEFRDGMKSILARIRGFELRFYAIMGGGVVVVWILERVWK